MFDLRACCASSVVVLATGCAGLAVPAATPGASPSLSTIEAVALEPDPGAGEAMALTTAPAAPQEPPSDSRWHGDLDFMLGVRGLLDEAWDPFASQGVLAMQLAIRPPRSLVGLEVGASLSANSDEEGPANTDVDGYIGEMWVGPQFALSDRRRGSMDVFVGAGVTYVNGTVERAIASQSGVIVVDDSDSSVGGYGHAGIAWRISKALRLGFDIRGVFGTDLTLLGQAADADYLQAAFVFGVGW